MLEIRSRYVATHVLLLGLASVSMVGCIDEFKSCADNSTCVDPEVGGAGGGTPDTTGGSGGKKEVDPTGGNGGTGGKVEPDDGKDDTPAECQVNPADDGSVVRDECGIFVRSLGNDANEGTKDSPIKTLEQAIAQASLKNKPRIFVCKETFTKPLNITSATPNVTIYGGLDCNTWAYAADQYTAISPGAGEVALKLDGAQGVKFQGFHFKGSASGAAGSSAIAAIANESQAEFAKCKFEVGDGVAGAKGADAPQTNTLVGPNGNNGADGCNASSIATPAPQIECTFDNGQKLKTVGGPGGISWNTNETVPPTCEGSGTGGPLGGINTCQFLVIMQTGGAGTPEVSQSSGSGGPPGASPGNGTPGSTFSDNRSGQAASGIGSIATLGFTPPLASPGLYGRPGEGGGGGGGLYNKCSTNASMSPATGGSGGAGGCGGQGGGAGTSGGSSIALVSVASMLSFESVSFALGAGRAGGDGGLGQPGANGGGAGIGGITSGKRAGNGARGGNGQAGGRGGGGAGGHSIAIAYKGTEPTMSAVTFAHTSGGTPVAAAPGGNSGLANAGASGLVQDVQLFP